VALEAARGRQNNARMKSFPVEWVTWVPALLATSAGCALVGYDLSGYGPVDASGAGGSAASQSTAASQSAGAGG
jgi:hypothetical protein